VEASESPGTSTTSETDATTDVTVAFGALATEPESPLELPPETPASDELRQNLDQGPAVDSAERSAHLSEPAPERAKIEKMAKYAALADGDKPWWRRLV
jgi:hypothetical protein